jgi:hypothetical protein
MRGRWASRAGAWLGLWAALAWPASAWGARSIAPSAVRGEPSDARPAGEVDIGELWQQAQARSDTADYGEAIVLLTRLYEAIAADPEAEALRLRVQWALHQAHLGAWGVDRDPTHLYVARDLLRKYGEALPVGEVEQRAKAAAALADVEALVTSEQARTEPEPTPEPRPEPEPELEPTEPAPEPAQPRPLPSSHRPLILLGSIGVGLGVAGLGVMAGGLGYADAAVERFETQPQERAAARSDIGRGNTIAVAGAAAGGVLLVGGAVVLALGLQRRSRAGGSLAAGPAALGLGWRVRF